MGRFLAMRCRTLATAALWLAVVAILLGTMPSSAAADGADTVPDGGWIGPEGEPLPFADDEEVLEFLRRAEVLGWKELSSGTNRPSKVYLEWKGVKANAIFRTVDIRERRARLENRIIPDFHDSHIYECAAYEVARALGIDNVPPCVRRMVDLKQGSLQLWVENAMMERDRSEEGKVPPEAVRWVRQKQTMRLFDALIYNFDRNQTNMLIDEDWKLWFVDHTRSFRRENKIDAPGKIMWCERELWQRLQDLDKKQLAPAKRYVTGTQINAILKRRDLLVEHLQALIEQNGEDAVIYDAGETEVAADLLERATELEDEYPEVSTPVASAENEG